MAEGGKTFVIVIFVKQVEIEWREEIEQKTILDGFYHLIIYSWSNFWKNQYSESDAKRWQKLNNYFVMFGLW